MMTEGRMVHRTPPRISRYQLLLFASIYLIYLFFFLHSHLSPTVDAINGPLDLILVEQHGVIRVKYERKIVYSKE